MSIERARITFQPRNTVNCLDLAVKFAGQRISRILALWCVVAIPSCAAVYALSRWLSLGLGTAAGITLLATSSLGVLISLDAIPAAMGEPDSREDLWKRLRRLGPALLWKGLGLRLLFAAGLVLIVPGVWVALRTGFFVEQAYFSETQPAAAGTHVKKLLRAASGDLFTRGLWIMLFSGLLILSISLLVDYTSNLFNVPIFIGRIAESMPAYDRLEMFDIPDILSDIFYLLSRDPRVLTTLTAVTLFVYTIGRLAWFFCYVDVRVRRDLWDTELEFSRLAARMKGGA